MGNQGQNRCGKNRDKTPNTYERKMCVFALHGLASLVAGWLVGGLVGWLGWLGWVLSIYHHIVCL